MLHQNIFVFQKRVTAWLLGPTMSTTPFKENWRFFVHKGCLWELFWNFGVACSMNFILIQSWGLRFHKISFCFLCMLTGQFEGENILKNSNDTKCLPTTWFLRIFIKMAFSVLISVSQQRCMQGLWAQPTKEACFRPLVGRLCQIHCSFLYCIILTSIKSTCSYSIWDLCKETHFCIQECFSKIGSFFWKEMSCYVKCPRKNWQNITKNDISTWKIKVIESKLLSRVRVSISGLDG